MKSYTLWNNKGGVGKSLLTFILSTEYARAHPDKSVLVIDLCPQADISQLLLGGTKNEGKNYESILQQKKTIGHYFDERIGRSAFALLGTETEYFIHIASYNPNMPTNLYLLCGDNSLEIISTSLESLINTTGIDGKAKYREVLGMVKDLKLPFTNKYKDNSCLFIDTNPSFSIYTKMAILAADQLIVPCLADYGSSLALKNVLHLLYGVKKKNGIEFNTKQVLKTQAEQYELNLPIIAHVIFGRSTIYDKKSAQAFKNIEEEMRQYLTEMKKKYNGTIFSNQNQVEYELPDMNSLVPAITYDPQVVSTMPIMVEISQKKIKINGLKKYQMKISKLIKLL